MQLTLLAATGPSGAVLINEALKAGHTLVIYARSPQKLDPSLKEDSRVRIVEGTITEKDYDAFRSSLTGSGAVICVLAPLEGMPKWAGGSNADLTQTKAYEIILRGMSEAGVKRFVATGTPSYPDPKDRGHLLQFVVRILSWIGPKVVHDVKSSHGELERWRSKVDWVWLRVSLVNGKDNGEYKLGYLGDAGRVGMQSISKKGLARALLDNIEGDSWVGQAPAIWSA